MLEFHKPGKAYKSVKREQVRLTDAAGLPVQHGVTVYMATAGTPHFAVGVPNEYAVAWAKHRHQRFQGMHRSDFYVADGAVTAPSYSEVMAKVAALSDNYFLHISNITMRKVICLGMEIKHTDPKLCHHSPSFSSSRVLVGIRSGIFWEVNGALYAAPKGYSFNDDADEDPGNPPFGELLPSSFQAGGVRLPFTKEAWATITQVEEMLEKAGAMLHSLTKADSAQLALQNGFQALLNPPNVKQS